MPSLPGARTLPSRYRRRRHLPGARDPPPPVSPRADSPQHSVGVRAIPSPGSPREAAKPEVKRGVKAGGGGSAAVSASRLPAPHRATPEQLTARRPALPHARTPGGGGAAPAPPRGPPPPGAGPALTEAAPPAPVPQPPRHTGISQQPPRDAAGPARPPSLSAPARCAPRRNAGAASSSPQGGWFRRRRCLSAGRY